MPTFSAAQALRAHTQDARLSAPARFSAAQVPGQPAQVVRLELEDFPDVHFAAEQVEPQPTQRPRLVLATWRGPAEPRPEGVPATPRPY
jgi:hypothetical protein